MHMRALRKANPYFGQRTKRRSYGEGEYELSQARFQDFVDEQNTPVVSSCE